MNNISWWRISFGDEEVRKISESIAGEHISLGPVTAEFEQALADTLEIGYVVATTNGSTAILMALIAAGVGVGDEVIVPDRTWIATAHAPLLLGAKAVLADVEKGRPIMDVRKLEGKITSRTKVIMPVHLNGCSLDMKEVKRIALKYNLLVIEDAAQAFYSRNKHGFLGTQSFAGCFSLSLTKLISTGQGGFVVTRDNRTYEKLKLIRTHGVSDAINVSYTQLGFNFRFNDILASIGLVQLSRLADKIERVKAVYSKYEAAAQKLPFLKFIPVDVEAGQIPIYIEALCPERDKFIKFLADNGIQARPFYPSLNNADYLSQAGDFPNSKVFAEQGLFLPSGPGQPIEDIDRAIGILRKYTG